MTAPEELGDVTFGDIRLVLEADQGLVEDGGGTGGGAGLSGDGHRFGEQGAGGIESVLDKGCGFEHAKPLAGKAVSERAVGVGGGAEDFGKIELAIPDSLFRGGQRERCKSGRPSECVLGQHGPLPTARPGGL
ncbi:MAG: hypothetical protein M5U18_09220 [Dehalococcoidia bacterium]|nr:hypothetical protein [Dehalococcoidia bacterium]